jgi:hypothetical protein
MGWKPDLAMPSFQPPVEVSGLQSHATLAGCSHMSYQAASRAVATIVAVVMIES